MLERWRLQRWKVCHLLVWVCHTLTPLEAKWPGGCKGSKKGDFLEKGKQCLYSRSSCPAIVVYLNIPKKNMNTILKVNESLAWKNVKPASYQDRIPCSCWHNWANMCNPTWLHPGWFNTGDNSKSLKWNIYKTNFVQGYQISPNNCSNPYWTWTSAPARGASCSVQIQTIECFV